MITWDVLAETDPLWAILSDPSKRYGRWDVQEFFSTGTVEISKALDNCHAFGLPKAHHLAIDFGCGVGRLTRALSAHFEKSVGIDGSEKMIKLAKHWNEGVRNCEFIVNEDERLPLADACADIVYCVLVLQHMDSDNQILNWITEFTRILSPEGVLIFQLPTKLPLLNRIQPRRRAWSLMSRIGISTSTLHRMGLAPISMRGIKPAHVRKHLDSVAGARICMEALDGRAGPHPSYTYFVTKHR